MDPSRPTLGFLLHDVARLLRKRFEQKARQLGLTRSQWQAIAYLANNEGIHQAALADLLDLEPITLTRILDRLAERGLIERRQHPTDRRTRLLYLTDAARPLLGQMQKIGDATRGEAFGTDIKEAERQQLLSTLMRMKTNLLAASHTGADDREVHYG
jgi:MarR family transcriptional regulator for hemolysin